MKTQLSLFIEKSVVEEARALLKKEGQNLSRTFEDYLKHLISKKKKKAVYPDSQDELLPEVSELIGIFKTKNPDNRPYKERLEEELQKKYGGQK